MKTYWKVIKPSSKNFKTFDELYASMHQLTNASQGNCHKNGKKKKKTQMVNDNLVPQIWFVWMENMKNMVLNFDGLTVIGFG